MGLDANTSPGLDGLTHAFLALVGGISSSDTPGNGPFSEKQFPELGRQLQKINWPFSHMLYVQYIYHGMKNGTRGKAGISSVLRSW